MADYNLNSILEECPILKRIMSLYCHNEINNLEKQSKRPFLRFSFMPNLFIRNIETKRPQNSALSDTHKACILYGVKSIELDTQSHAKV